MDISQFLICLMHKYDSVKQLSPSRKAEKGEVSTLECRLTGRFSYLMDHRISSRKRCINSRFTDGLVARNSSLLLSFKRGFSHETAFELPRASLERL
ncbi:hypothetical protein NPIL_80291 [Nephila pilipes]|uniref:Uncharacterized protein n=1 Tax=Nephila pilipes TaxID=299642 RepID=A0A8X6U3P5_NEPPI|nr:hypothetical protein NPIL_80291 [Nephila pilipes]